MKNKKRIWIYLLMVIGFVSIFNFGCKKDDNNNPKETDQVPVLETTAVSDITQTTANCGGNITSDGGSNVTARGVCWSSTGNPTIFNSKTVNGRGTGIFTSSITGLTVHTIYYIRAYATNRIGTAYGNTIQFTSGDTVPTLTTSIISIFTQTAARCGGTVSSDGGDSVTARGVCWDISPNPTIDNNRTTDSLGRETFNSKITGLSANTTYYVRAYAINSKGTGYGNDITFKTNAILTDNDGNAYNTVTIGTKIWMVENLKTTHYSNGNPIPNVTDDTQWSILSTGAYCDYDNTPGNSTIYGKLYNWYAVKDTLKICPVGWHVSSDADWTLLTTYFGGESVAANILKDSGATHWFEPNIGVTNRSFFTALPGGNRYNDGSFDYIGLYGLWWTSSEYDARSAWYRTMHHDNSNVFSNGHDKGDGFSVRCVRD